MRFAPGTYRVDLPAGSTIVVADNDDKAVQLDAWVRQQRAGIGHAAQGGVMGQFSHTLRPITGPDGPWWVISRNPDGTDFNVTLTVPTLASALDVAKADGASILSAASATAKNIDIFTTF